jgi:DNA processing protein
VKTQEFTPEDLLGPLNDVERKNAPTKLYLAGDPSIFSRGPRVSIVGSRKASPAALQRTRSLSGQLASRGVVIVSGLAEGVDTAAHEAAMAAGGRTVAVLGTPLDRVYPRQNRALQNRIAREHAVVSQFALGTPSRPGNFPIRNRTMALLSDATVIMDAGETSGTRHQGLEALRLGRLLLLTRNLAAAGRTSWIRPMIRAGAVVLEDGAWNVILEALPRRLGPASSSAVF